MSDPAHIDGKYRVLERLGQGGYGTVYLCKSNDLDKNVAVKVLKRNDGDDLQTKRFLNEAKALAKCSHPGIIHVFRFNVTTDGAALYYVMDALNGHSLSHELETKGPLAPRRLIKIFSQVFDALEHGHQQGIVHRDIKPANIMLTLDEKGQEQAVLIDYGIMRLQSQDVKLTATGDVLGTVFYMSPEQCQGAVADFRSDLYSTGCTIYEAATGRPPFEGDSYSVLIDHINNLPTNVPEYLSAFLSMCMAKDRSARFGSAKEAADALVEIGNSAVIDDRLSGEKQSKTPRKGLSQTRGIQTAFTIAGLCSLALAGVFVGLYMTRDQTPLPPPELTQAQTEPVKKDERSATLESRMKDVGIQALFQSMHGRVPEALAACQSALDEVDNGHQSEGVLFYPLSARAKIVSLFCGDQAQLKQALHDTQRIIGFSGSEINYERKARAHMIKARLLSKLGDDMQAGKEYEFGIKLAGNDLTKFGWGDTLIDYSRWLKGRGNEERRNSILLMAFEDYHRSKNSIDEAKTFQELVKRDLSKQASSVRVLALRIQSDGDSGDGTEIVQAWKRSAYLLHSAKLNSECREAALTALTISDEVEPHPRIQGLETIQFLLAKKLCNGSQELKLAQSAYKESKPYKGSIPSVFAQAARDLGNLEMSKGKRKEALGAGMTKALQAKIP